MGNPALACQGCNSHKYNKLEAQNPTTGAVVHLYHPRKDSWEDHFAWDSGFSLIIGLTTVGRATGQLLQLNRRGVVNVRRV